MAFRRCHADGHALLARSALMYVGFGRGDDMQRYRLRFCAKHIAAVYEDLAQHEVNPEDGTLSGGDDLMTQCLACGQPVNQTGWHLFLTSYPTKNERKDHWACLHVDCSVPALIAKSEYAENC